MDRRYMPEKKGSVPGRHNEHRTIFYGLSTCVWCKRTRRFLEDQGIAFDYIYVDLLSGQEREEVLTRVRRWNLKTSFPTIVVDDSRCVVGYKPEQIKEALGL
jgi:glutaredoxin-like protein NrdH